MMDAHIPLMLILCLMSIGIGLGCGIVFYHGIVSLGTAWINGRVEIHKAKIKNKLSEISEWSKT